MLSGQRAKSKQKQELVQKEKSLFKGLMS